MPSFHEWTQIDKDKLEKDIKNYEPNPQLWMLYSIAISCKRIADRIDNVDNTTADILTKMIHGTL